MDNEEDVSTTSYESHNMMMPSVESSPINIKDFIKYLDKTLDLFDNQCDYTDFQNPNSDVYRMFSTLFRTYCNLADNECTSETDREHGNNLIKKQRKHPTKSNKNIKKFKTYLDDRMDSNVSKIITKKLELDHIHHCETSTKNPRKKRKPHTSKKYDIDSDKDARHLYKKSVKKVKRNLTESDDDLGPIIYSEQVSAHKRYLQTTNNKTRSSLLDELREIRNKEYITDDDEEVKHKKNNRREPKNEPDFDSLYESKSLSEHNLELNPKPRIRQRNNKNVTSVNKKNNAQEALVRSKLKSIREDYEDFDDNNIDEPKEKPDTAMFTTNTATATLPTINNSIASIRADTDVLEQKINSMKKVLNLNR